MSIELEQLNTDPGEGGGRPLPLFLDDVLGSGAIHASAAYIHVPFCFHKCHYCDFYSIVDKRDRTGDFVTRLENEARSVAERIDASRIRTIFVGGGTPTILPPDELQRVLEAVRSLAGRDPLEEFTVEANPETVDAAIAGALVAAGVDRVSIGCQHR